MPFAWDPTGSVGVIGVYIAPDSGAKDEQRKQGIFSFPLANFFEKGLTIGTGQDPVKKYNEYLRDLIVSGRALERRWPHSAALRNFEGSVESSFPTELCRKCIKLVNWRES